MSKFKIHLVTVASTEVEIEADSAEEALDQVWEMELPYAPGFAKYEFGEWTTPSELFPGVSKPEDDYTEVAD